MIFHDVFGEHVVNVKNLGGFQMKILVKLYSRPTTKPTGEKDPAVFSATTNLSNRLNPPTLREIRSTVSGMHLNTSYGKEIQEGDIIRVDHFCGQSELFFVLESLCYCFNVENNIFSNLVGYTTPTKIAEAALGTTDIYRIEIETSSTLKASVYDAMVRLGYIKLTPTVPTPNF